MADKTLSDADTTQATAEAVVFDGHPAALDSVGRWLVALLTLGVAGLWYWVASRTLRIRITNQRLIRRTGLLTIETDNFELYRVTDIRIIEPLGERLLGYGRLVLESSDRSDPHIELRGLHAPEELADRIRLCVEEQKREHRVATFAEA